MTKIQEALRQIVAVIVLLGCTASASSSTQESEIRILALTTGGASLPDVLDQMDYIDDYFPTSNGVSVQLVNGGVPVPLTSATYTGSKESQLSSIESLSDLIALRNTWYADIVIVYTGATSTGCGLARQVNWTSINDPIAGAFLPNPATGLDLLGSENSYYAVASTASTCPVQTSAHEVVHLLGGGHTKLKDPGRYLFDWSHASASVFLSFSAGGLIGSKTVGAENENPPLCSTAMVQCTYSNLFSKQANVADNEGTFDVTAKSVANYRVGSPGSTGGGTTGGGGGGSGSCSLQAPVALTSTLVGFCSPAPYTQYTLTWIDLCPNATSYYEVESRQPVSSPWVFEGQVIAPASPVYINGPPGDVRVRACTVFGGCSGFSNIVRIVDGC